MIKPEDVIRRFTVEELCETADEYYRRIDDPTPLMSKPFTFLHEAPEALQNLGLLIGGLQLGKTMTVLDFGGGTGWLSRFLAQLNCQPVCCDTSRAALAIGERLMREWPLIGTAVYQPRFLWFDGHRIDLPDASVDRILCFDAFHHVPNQADVLAEFGRVLKPGGLAGFSEPGRKHAESPQSQYEMANHRVLENNIDLNAIFALAKPAGFTRLSLQVVTDLEMSLEDHDVLFAAEESPAKDRLKNDVWNQTYNTMTNRAIFFLHKGPLGRDSRSHIGLAHRLVVAPRDTSGRTATFRASLTNTGVATWLAQNSEIFGVVRLGTHLYDADGRLREIDFTRHGLPHDVRPGQTIDMAVEIELPSPARYRLAFDLVAEGVTWFENVGSTPVYLDVSLESA